MHLRCYTGCILGGSRREVMARPLHDYRRERYMTVEEFVDFLGISLRTFYNILGKKSPPRITTMRRVAKKLGVHPSEIEEFVHKPQSH
jgi:transcriptional regulator with XRE-family HTH domain